MTDEIRAMRESLVATSTETGTSLAELNSNMEKFLTQFCVLLTSESECNSTEAVE